MVPRRRFSRRLLAVAAALTVFFFYHFLSSDTDRPWRPHFTTTDITPDLDENGEPAPFCPPLPGIEDVLVVMKTGVTESREKVPVHFQTTLRCIPHYVIYSDFEEEIEGVKIHDVLRDMDSSAKKNPDFEFYNRIVKYGRKGLEQQDFADEANSAIGKPNNPGWKLDKWKFLPMAQEALHYKSNAKWYVFIEADTYVSWPTILNWLARFDHTKPQYLGTETQIADVVFAHGGSGFMLSNPALQRASDEYSSRELELNAYTDGHWAGDCVLGKVLADAGVNLHFTWPILQNSNIGELDEFTVDFYRHPWCFIAVALHHLSPSDIENLWKFEQKRWRDVSTLPLPRSPTHKRLTLLRHRKTNVSCYTVTSSANIFTKKSQPNPPVSTGTTWQPTNNLSRTPSRSVASFATRTRPARNLCSGTTPVSQAPTRVLEMPCPAAVTQLPVGSRVASVI